MSDGRMIEGRLRANRGVCLCRLTGVEARWLARRYGPLPVAEALRRDAARDAEADRRAFVRRLWGNRVVR
jgi:hypothetical protein